MGWPVTIPEDKAVVAQTAIQRYLDDERIEDIAKGYGVTDKRLYQLLLETHEEQWKQAQVAHAVSRLQACEDELKGAKNMLEIARAREAARIAQWKLERLCRRIYGTDAPPTAGQGTVAIQINFNHAKPEPQE